MPNQLLKAVQILSLRHLDGFRSGSIGAAEAGPARRQDDGSAILPPPCLVMTTTAGRGGTPSWKSGQRSPSSPGCCTARSRAVTSGVKIGPHISAPAGQRKKCLEVARCSPSV